MNNKLDEQIIEILHNILNDRTNFNYFDVTFEYENRFEIRFTIENIDEKPNANIASLEPLMYSNDLIKQYDVTAKFNLFYDKSFHLCTIVILPYYYNDKNNSNVENKFWRMIKISGVDFKTFKQKLFSLYIFRYNYNSDYYFNTFAKKMEQFSYNNKHINTIEDL
jgi:hypothetical protein